MREKNNGKSSGKGNNKLMLYMVIICMCVLIIMIIGLILFDNVEKPLSNNSENTSVVEEKDSEEKYLVVNNKKILKSDLNLTKNAKINASKEDVKNGIVILDVIEPDFQFETHYLLCFDKDNKLIFDARDFKDSDNDNNRYKFNGAFEYKEGILSLYTNLFLGENDEASGTAFNDKYISDLTNEEKTKLGNYSDTVKYDYKYENKKMNFVKKQEIDKLKDNVYYKDLLIVE